MKLNLKENKSICAFPFKHLHINSNGDIKTCCYTDYILKSERGENLNILKHNIETIWDSNDLKNIKSCMLENKLLDMCSNCNVREKDGMLSFRQKSFYNFNVDDTKERTFEEFEIDFTPSSKPTDLHLVLGNQCNLQCRMCSPSYSSTLGREIDEIKENSSDTDKTYNLFKTLYPQSSKVQSFSSSQFYENIDQLLPNLNHLTITGGEPFISKDFYRLIDKCVQNGYASNISLTITSNLSVYNSELCELLRSFKSLTLFASIDGTKEVFEYIRYPLKWETFKDNLQKYFNSLKNDSFYLSFSIVPQIYNVLNLPDLFNFIKSFYEKNLNGMPDYYPYYINYLQNPSFFNIRHTPKSLLPLIEKSYNKFLTSENSFRFLEIELNNIISSIKNSETTPETYNDFLLYSKALDLYRSQDFAEVFPIHSKSINHLARNYSDI